MKARVVMRNGHRFEFDMTAPPTGVPFKIEFVAAEDWPDNTPLRRSLDLPIQTPKYIKPRTADFKGFVDCTPEYWERA